MVEIKIQKIGDSCVLALPDEILALLGRTEGQSVFVDGDSNGEVRIFSEDPHLELKLAAAQDIARRYSNTLRELAK